jgi:hypothetical protein
MLFAPAFPIELQLSENDVFRRREGESFAPSLSRFKGPAKRSTGLRSGMEPATAHLRGDLIGRPLRVLSPKSRRLEPARGSDHLHAEFEPTRGRHRTDDISLRRVHGSVVKV